MSTILFTVHSNIEVNDDTNNYLHEACYRGKKEIVMELWKRTKLKFFVLEHLST